MWPWQYPMVRGVPPSSQGQDYEVQFVPIVVPRSSSTRVEPTLMPQVPPPGFRMQSPSVVTETVNPWGVYNPMMSPYFSTSPGAYADYLRLSASALHHSVVTDSSQVLPDAPLVASSVVTDPSQDLPSAPSVVSSVVTDLSTTVSSASSVAPSVMTDSPSLSSVPQTVPAVPAMPVSAAVASLPPAEDASLPVPPSVSSVEDMVVSGSTKSHGPAVASPSPSQKDLSTSVVSGTVSSAPLSSEDRPLQRPLPARSPHSPHLTSAKRVRSGGDRVPGPMSLVRDDCVWRFFYAGSCAFIYWSPRTFSTTLPVRAVPVFYWEAITASDPVPSSLVCCSSVRVLRMWRQLCATGTFVHSPPWASPFSTTWVGRLLSQSAWYLCHAHVCFVGFDCLPHRSSFSWRPTYYVTVVSRRLHSFYRVLTGRSILHSADFCCFWPL